MDSPQTIRVLLVEDNPDAAASLKMRLESDPVVRAVAEFVVTVAHRGQAGMEVLQNHPFDVVLLDLMLPCMQGGETVRNFQACCPETPIVALSASQDVRVQRECLREGAQEFVDKVRASGEIEYLVRAVLRSIERHRVRGQYQRAKDACTLTDSKLLEIIRLAEEGIREEEDSPFPPATK